MATEKTNGANQKVTNKPLFLIMSLLVLVSLGFVVYGLMKNKMNYESTEQAVNDPNSGETDDSVSKYFDQEIDIDSIDPSADEYLINDPYKEICASTSGDDLPAINTGTVCLR